MDRLTVGEYRQLNGHGDAVRIANTRAEREDAISVVVRACAAHHGRGVSWTVLAVAVGVAPETLRRWRLRHGPDSKTRGTIDSAATTLDLAQHAARSSTAASAAGARGDPSVESFTRRGIRSPAATTSRPRPPPSEGASRRTVSTSVSTVASRPATCTRCSPHYGRRY